MRHFWVIFKLCAKGELSLDLVNVFTDSVIIANNSNPEDVDQDLVILAQTQLLKNMKSKSPKIT